ncbi:MULTISPECIES: hypothetical protein [unclassified Mycolicibacterium]|uniref:hypothetical protein n=1 Tax=unclassified Mycolicibacterium TaxID=2636767 RepID=UPI0012DC303C|nr:MULTISPECIES: hypothetical protein [unclassified Mycolicibacterium]MUL84325.1 hypothetical protein [Mycolicibacterium sp. CBMA 329]MUL89609.1 hypothetical protein [Mycolicibacterium sp. CBMA 331]MUL99785.1 hypothetical protein [Mycolicibacterium sp. CBMA 334]MUM29576.1 hypothetical protein [Mycolicibacterium sp. CBMA 295]MUM39124.1 hypothetical protein [Mycolicibacterium sp. CBMA 247]
MSTRCQLSGGPRDDGAVQGDRGAETVGVGLGVPLLDAPVMITSARDEVPTPGERHLILIAAEAPAA